MPPSRRHRPRGAPARLVWRHVTRALIPSLLVVLISALVGFTASDYFRLRQVTVVAGDPSLAEEVAGRLCVPEAANTIYVSLRGLVAQAETCPRVLTARASRDFPSRIVIAVRERQPALALQTAGRYVLVDREGVLLVNTGRPMPGAPLVVGSPTAGTGTGSRLSPDCMQAVMACMEGARKAGMGLNFTLVLATRYDFRMVTPSRVLVKLGGPDNLVRKVLVAASIEQQVAPRVGRLKYIDVRVPLRPVYRPDEGPA